ncbi:MAG: hypothetical protein ACM3N0_04675 [Chloroflexota bacterium]
MKQIKTLCLISLVALLAVAVVEASSAMAESTTLCSVDPGEGEEETCPEEQMIEHVHEVTEAGKPAILETSTLTVECDTLFLGDRHGNSESGAALIEGNFTYTKCSNSCTVTETSPNSLIEVLRLGHELADVTGEGEVNVHCGIFVNCTYGEKGVSGHALGSLLASVENGQTTFKEQTIHKVAGAFCPEEATLSISTSPLVKTYITAAAMECRAMRFSNNLWTNVSTTRSRLCISDDPQKKGFWLLVPETGVE